MRDPSPEESPIVSTRDQSIRGRYTIFAVDKGNDLRKIRRILTSEGFQVSCFQSGESAISKALHEPPAMFILEVALRREDGLSLCARIRRTSGLSLVPVLFLSRRRQEADRVAGLSAGGDDYITKPFGERELIARVKASLRRCYELRTPALVQLGDIEINSDSISLTVKGVPVEISLSEFRLLEYFVRNPGRTFGRDHLLQVVRSSSREVNPRIVDVYVKRIRKKIEEDENNPRYLRTVRGLGYCLHVQEPAKRSPSSKILRRT